MSWYWHLWWGLICLFAIYRFGAAIYALAVVQANIEKERNRREDLRANSK